MYYNPIDDHNILFDLDFVYWQEWYAEMMYNYQLECKAEYFGGC